MHQHMNEDVAFERLKDLQREMENTRLTAAALAGLGHRIHELTARAAKSLALQYGNLLGVRTISSAGHLEDEGEPGEPRLVQQGTKALLANLSGPDIRVTVSVGAETGDGVVAVDHLDA